MVGRKWFPQEENRFELEDDVPEQMFLPVLGGYPSNKPVVVSGFVTVSGHLQRRAVFYRGPLVPCGKNVIHLRCGLARAGFGVSEAVPGRWNIMERQHADNQSACQRSEKAEEGQE
jgi:hypothetical protein